MKVMIDIPKDFEEHFDNDRFKDSLERIKADLNEDFVFAGNYERELLDMLEVAFEEARIIESSRSSYNPYPSFFAEDYVDPR